MASWVSACEVDRTKLRLPGLSVKVWSMQRLWVSIGDAIPPRGLTLRQWTMAWPCCSCCCLLWNGCWAGKLLQRQSHVFKMWPFVQIFSILKHLLYRIFLKKQYKDLYKNKNPTIITHDPLKVCGGVCICRDPVLSLYFLIILLCFGCFYVSAFGQCCVAPS